MAWKEQSLALCQWSTSLTTGVVQQAAKVSLAIACFLNHGWQLLIDRRAYGGGLCGGGARGATVEEADATEDEDE